MSGSSLKLVTLDCETSGVDVNKDRIITFFMRAKKGEEVVYENNWIINPGIEIPDGAAKVHGMSTEWVQENGRTDVNEAISSILFALEGFAKKDYIVCGYNHSFDLKILDSESKRHFMDHLTFPDTARFLDPLVIDRHIDRYRKGSRKLADVAKWYGVEVDESLLHDASGDVELTEQLVPKVLNAAWNKLKTEREGMSPDDFITWLQDKQREWKAEWAEHLTEYFAKAGRTEDDGSPIVVSGAFPY